MTKTDTWMPLHIGDYLADTTHLSMAEHGAYLLLIMTYWRTGPLPDSDKALANMAKCDRKLWLAEIGPVMREFFVPKDGKLHHKRIDLELQKAADLSAKKKAAAEARWGAKDEGTVSSGDAGASSPASANGHPPDDAEPIQDTCHYARVPQSQSPKPKPVEENRSLRSLVHSSDVCNDFAAFWAAYPRREAKRNAEKAWVSAIKRASPDAIIAAARAQNWPDPKYIPLPASWLNADRWLDEARAPSPPKLGRLGQMRADLDRAWDQHTEQTARVPYDA